MADAPPALTPQDYDPWRVASPLQLLTLLRRLGVTSRVIARWCGVPPTHVSMWLHGTRPVPLRYAPILYQRARLTLRDAAKLNDKEVAAQPTEALQRATQAEFAGIWTRWKLEVLHEAGTMRRGLEQQYAALGLVLRKDPFTAEDEETAVLLTEGILAKMKMLRTLEPEAPRAEDHLLHRLTQAHETAAKQQGPPGDEDAVPPDA